MDDRPETPPEGKLISEALRRSGMSMRQASRRARISYGRWRQVASGYQSAGGGSFIPVRAPATTLARMAASVGVTPEALDDAGRADAAEILRLDAADGQSRAPGDRRYDDENLQKIWELDLPEDVRLGLVALAEGMRAQRAREQRGERGA